MLCSHAITKENSFWDCPIHSRVKTTNSFQTDRTRNMDWTNLLFSVKWRITLEISVYMCVCLYVFVEGDNSSPFTTRKNLNKSVDPIPIIIFNMTKFQGVIQKFEFHLQSATKSFGKFLKITQNCAKSEKFGIFFCAIWPLLPKISFWRGEGILACVSTQFWDFLFFFLNS